MPGIDVILRVIAAHGGGGIETKTTGKRPSNGLDEIQRLRDRIAELEAELAARSPAAPESRFAGEGIIASITELTSLGRWRVEVPGGEITVDDETLRILRLDRAHRPLHVSEIVAMIAPEDRPAIERVLARRGPRGGERQIEFRIDGADGSAAWCRITGDLDLDGDGNRVAISGFIQDITAQRAAERRLRLVQTSIDMMTTAVYWVRPDGAFAYVNDHAGRMLGYTREELLAMSIADIDPTFRHEDRPAQWQRFKTERKSVIERTNRTRDGRLIPVLIASHHVEFEGEEFQLAFVEDISARKEVEETLRHSEDRFRAVAENLFDLVSISGMDGVFTYANFAHEEILGYVPAELIGTRFLDYIHPDDLASVAESITHVVATFPAQRSGSATFRFRCADGSYRWLECNGRVLVGDRGESAGMLFSGRDINDRIRNERNLLEQQRELSIRNAIAELFLTTDDQSIYRRVVEIILAATGSAHGLFGIVDERGYLILPSLSEHLFGEPSSDGRPPEFPPETWGGLWGRALLEKHTFMANGDLRVPEGHVPIARAIATPVVFRDEVIGVLTVTDKANDYDRDDVALLERIADNIAPILHARREHDRAESRRAATEEQLRQSQKMEAIGRLAGGVAHDFNNLLTAIRGAADLLMTSLPETDPAINDVRHIAAATETGARLTQQLLAFGRKQTISPRLLDLNDVVRRTESMLSRVIGENLVLDVQTAPDLWPVLADAGQIDQILANLVVNARDAIDRAGRITIRTANAPQPAHACANCEGEVAGDYVALSVTDDGAGMDEATVKRIFEPFFTTKLSDRGTGLGLSTVLGIVRQNRGHIAVDTAPGRGSTFTIYLPRAFGSADAVVADVRVEPGRGSAQLILFVEDQPEVRDITTRILENFGFRVLSAANPDEAAVLFAREKNNIDMLVSDVLLPRINGWEMFKNFQAEKPDLRVLFVSGYPADVIAEQGVAFEGIRFLRKPFRAAELIQQVRAALNDLPG